MIEARTPPARRRQWTLRSRALRGVLYQVLAVAVIALAVWFLAHNTLANMKARGIQSGFDFLLQPAGFDIGETMLPYESTNGYWRAFAVGVAQVVVLQSGRIISTRDMETSLLVSATMRSAAFSRFTRRSLDRTGRPAVHTPAALFVRPRGITEVPRAAVPAGRRREPCSGQDENRQAPYLHRR